MEVFLEFEANLWGYMAELKAVSMADLMVACKGFSSYISFFLFSLAALAGGLKLRPLGPLNKSLFLSSAPSMVSHLNARYARH